MRTLLEHNDAVDLRLLSGKWHPLTKILTSDHTIDDSGPIGHFLDPGGLPRIVTLPLVDEGLFYIVSNQGAETITVKNASGSTIGTLEAGISNLFYTDGQVWIRLVAATSVFGPVGPTHSSGLVPDPGPTPGPAVRFLGDDGAWHGALGGSLLDGYSFITDGTFTAAGTGNDTFKLRTSAKLTVVVTDNDGTHGDNALFDVVEGAIDHNALLNWAANKHIDHTAVSISAGSGLTGGGDISASRSLALNFGGLGSQAPVLGDTFAFLNGATHFKSTFTTLNGVLDHNSLLNYVANRHIDHTAVSITAGVGLSGGGDISASRTLNLNITGLSALVGGIAAGDEFALYDVSATSHVKITFNTLNAGLDHNALTNYVADQHVAHSGVTLTAGAGLTGGGTIAASRTFDVGAGTGIVVNANDVAIDPASTTDVLTGTSTAKVVTPDALAALWEKGADVASAGTVSLGEGSFFHITGTVTITDIDWATAKDGRAAFVIFDGILTLTHNATTLKLPGGANITTAAGDRAIFVQDASDNVICLAYIRADGTPIVIANDAITFAKMQNIATDSLIGRDTAGTGDPENILLNATLSMDGAGNLQRAALTGDVTASAGSNATAIANDAVTYAKMQNISATSRVLGRITAGAGDPEELTGANVRTVAGLATTDSPEFAGVNVGHASDSTITRLSAGNIAVEGNELYRAGGTDVPVADGGTGVSTLNAFAVLCGGLTGTGAIQALAALGTAGDVLTSNGAGALPSFQAGGGGGSSTINIQAFTASGTYTPTAGMDYCIVISTGGGGGGGGADVTTTDSHAGAGGGGGAGGTAIEMFSAATIGASQTVTIGAAGTAGSATNGTSGGNGGDTTFGALHTATGGTGGAGSGVTSAAFDSHAGGAGGVPTGGTLNVTGGMGTAGWAAANLASAAAAKIGRGGDGGGSYWGSGGTGGAMSGTVLVAAAAGVAYGSGGGGAATASNAGRAGGAGVAGVCLVIEFI